MPKILTKEAKSMISYALSYYHEMELDGYDMSDMDMDTIEDAKAWLKEQEVGRYPPSVNPTVPPEIEAYFLQMMLTAELIAGGTTVAIQQAREWLGQEVKPYGPTCWVVRARDQPKSDLTRDWLLYWAEEAINQYQPPNKTTPQEADVASRIIEMYGDKIPYAPESN